MVQQWKRGIHYLSTISALVGAVLPVVPSSAQLLQDNSLGAESSIVTPNINVGGQSADLIEGGAQRGTNLFHSFQEFNIGDAQRVYFANPTGVENILTRVTGTNPSNILGTLGSLGSANLFLINPNGIVFGSNATLDVGGSFVASTADSFQFNNGFAFSASNPQAPPLLTMNVPIGLQYGSNPGEIQLRGARLAVPTGETLALVGGNVSIRGRSLGASGEPNLTAPGGRIELASIAENNQVSLTPINTGYQLGYQGVGQFLDVVIADSALVNVAADGGGDIAVNSRNITILDSSDLIAGISANSSSAVSQAGNITFNAAGAVEIAGGSNVFNLVQPESVGNAGDIMITAHSIALDDGAQLGSYTYGRGNTGDVRLEVTDSLSLAGAGGNDGYSFIGNIIWPEAVGNTGNVMVTARSITFDDGAELGTYIYGTGTAGDVRLLVNGTLSLAGARDGGFVSSIGNQVLPGARGDGGDITITANAITFNDGAGLSTGTGGIGNAGNVTLNVTNTFSLTGLSPNGVGSTIQSLVGPEAIGNGGNITIRAGSILLDNGAYINSSTLGEGGAGDIAILVNAHLSFSGTNGDGDGSNIGSGVPEGDGDAGNITITARSITFNDGASVSSFSRGGDAGDINLIVTGTLSLTGIDANGLYSTIESVVAEEGVGDGGDITVIADTLSLSDSAQLDSNNLGQGVAGNIEVQARSVVLRDNAQITAETASGRGGNITLQNVDLLVLRDSSIISSTAGTAQAGGNGGNITFKGNFVVAVPNENSDISANAFQGSGGQISLTAQNILWFDFRTREDLQRILNTTDPLELDPQQLPTNDVTAFSQANPTIDTGAVIVQTPDLDPTQGVTTLPTDLSDPSQLIASTCPADEGSSFAITGRGGLPEDPRQPLMGQVIWQDERRVGKGEEDGEVEEVGGEDGEAIVEVQGWMVDRTGAVVLVARQPQTYQLSAIRQLSCVLLLNRSS